MSIGTVKWFNDDVGIGFIDPDDGGNEIFAHYSEIDTNDIKSLREGLRISFDVTDGDNGGQAANIRILH